MLLHGSEEVPCQDLFSEVLVELHVLRPAVRTESSKEPLLLELDQAPRNLDLDLVTRDGDPGMGEGTNPFQVQR